MSRSLVTLARMEAAATDWLLWSPFLMHFWGSVGFQGDDTVDQQEAGDQGEPPDGPFHRLAARHEDVQCVDFLLAHLRNRKGQGVFADQIIPPLPRRRPELLGIVDARVAFAGRQDHSGCDHRAGKRASAGFVQAGDVAVSLCQPGGLEMEHIRRRFPQVLLRGRAVHDFFFD